MGMYTELIVGCRLGEQTPPEVIQRLRDLIEGAPWDGPRTCFLRDHGSAYFGLSEPITVLQESPQGRGWHLSLRCNSNSPWIFEEFITWLRPFVAQGSGAGECWALRWYEEARYPVYEFLVAEEEGEDAAPA